MSYYSKIKHSQGFSIKIIHIKKYMNLQIYLATQVLLKE